MIQIFTQKRLYKTDPLYFGIFGTILSIIAVNGMQISGLMISKNWDVTFGVLSLISSFMLGFLGWLIIIYPALQYLDPIGGIVPSFREQLTMIAKSFRKLIP
jgi:hypothetical protein